MPSRNFLKVCFVEQQSGSQLEQDSPATVYDSAARLLEEGTPSVLPQVFALFGSEHDFLASDRGQATLADVLYLLLEGLNLNDAGAVLAAMEACPPGIARQGHDLLLAALCPGGEVDDPAALDDAAVLCLTLLLATSQQEKAAKHFLQRAGAGRTSLYFFRTASQITERFLTASESCEAFEPKLIIWDLDDTLWQGTLAEGDTPILDEGRAQIVRKLNRQGIVSAICSKNDLATARAVLEQMGLWDEFVFPRIAFVPKGPVVKQMIADMQLRPVNVLFIDDHPHNLHEVEQAVPGIHVIDARSPECDALLQKILADHAHIDKSRVADYRILETKVAERGEKALSDEDFLVQSEIHASCVWRMDNLEFAERIEELINRSNQLNYTESRVAPGEVTRYILDIDHYHVITAFVWDRYGYYGLVGVAIVNFRENKVEHFAFSCRVMHMGVEAFLIDGLGDFENSFPTAGLRKPLPAQTAAAITYAPFANKDVRERILAQEVPRDPSAIRLRVMADCQSGAFHHYSRFAEVMDHDNWPRQFTLPMMMNGEWEAQHFPPYLVYTAGTDYTAFRWERKLPEGMDDAVVYPAIERFADMVVSGGRKCLLLLPPENAPLYMFNLYAGCDLVQTQRAHQDYNKAWREVAARHPEHFRIIELPDVASEEEMKSHLHHYIPSTLRRIAGMMDDWYEQETMRAARLEPT